MLRAVVIDDEPLARDELLFLLSQCEDVEAVGEASDAASGMQLCEALRPDAAFVDLRMPGPDGVALAETLMARHPGLSVVLVSAHNDGAVRAFEARVLDYLLKPVRLERLRETVRRIVGSQGSLATSGGASASSRPSAAPSDGNLTRLAVRRRGAYVVIDIGDVVFFEVKDELVWAVTAEDRFALDLSLATVESRVPPSQFFRSHRGVLVRLDRIRAIEPQGAGLFSLRLDHPESPRVPLARERARLLRELIPFAG